MRTNRPLMDLFALLMNASGVINTNRTINVTHGENSKTDSEQKRKESRSIVIKR